MKKAWLWVWLVLVDRPTQLIYIEISICQHTSTKDIAGQSAWLVHSLNKS